jgi:hypothetical protein
MLRETVSILEKSNHILTLMYKSLVNNIKLILKEEIDDKEKLLKINRLN